jgi:YD repeat-containing protein
MPGKRPEMRSDPDGNLTSLVENSSETVYIWNAENRLIAVQPAAPADGDKKVEFIYDYMGRRVKKAVYVCSFGNWALSIYVPKNSPG